MLECQQCEHVDKSATQARKSLRQPLEEFRPNNWPLVAQQLWVPGQENAAGLFCRSRGERRDVQLVLKMVSANPQESKNYNQGAVFSTPPNQQHYIFTAYDAVDQDWSVEMKGTSPMSRTPVWLNLCPKRADKMMTLTMTAN
ncbi:uncharacterized [Tachysurus ichikawai]